MQIGYQKLVIGFSPVCESRVSQYADKLCEVGDKEAVIENTTTRSIACYVKDTANLSDYVKQINEFIDGSLSFFGRCDRIAVIRFSEGRSELDQIAAQKASNLF